MKRQIVVSCLKLLALFASSMLVACKPNSTSEGEKSPEIQEISSAPTTDAFLILPGDYAQGTAVTDLELRFGQMNVHRESGEDPTVIIFPNDPTRRAIVTFYEAPALDELSRITVREPSSLWRGKLGVHVGMTFSKLREINGKPFMLTGFDAQHRAMVIDSWSPAIGDDATLGALDVTEGDRLYFEVELGPIDTSKLPTKLPDEYQLSSDDPRLLPLAELIQVTAIIARSSLDDEWE